MVSGDRFDPIDLIPEPVSGSSGSVSPMLIDDPIAFAACFGVGAPQFADFPLRTYEWVPQAGGPVYLQCGPLST